METVIGHAQSLLAASMGLLALVLAARVAGDVLMWVARVAFPSTPND